MVDTWSANTYQQFLNERTRPARDLLAAIPDFFQPKNIYDLGCGPGNSTILLNNRWPQANVVGIDSSIDMLQKARSRYPHLHFVEGDILHFSPTEKIDFIFANASLHWVSNHEVVFPKLLHFINDGGILAIQMPNNFHAPAHQVIIDILQDNTDWQSLLTKLHYQKLLQPRYYLPWYYNLLTDAGAKSIQLWETEYFQEMASYQAVFDWVSGTVLRPILRSMDADSQAQFANQYVERIAKEYATQKNNRVLFPFKRLFMVASN